jgi:hypothetical protein
VVASRYANDGQPVSCGERLRAYAAAVIGLAPDVKPQLARRHVNDINDSD